MYAEHKFVLHLAETEHLKSYSVSFLMLFYNLPNWVKGHSETAITLFLDVSMRMTHLNYQGGGGLFHSEDQEEKHLDYKKFLKASLHIATLCV